jgi:hypothetical protein
MSNDRPRNIANDIVDAIESATKKWTRQRKSEERHPGMRHYRASRMTREPRVTQKEAAWEVMPAAYMAASANGRLPAKARQIYYQARPKIMAMTENKELAYGYFSQVLLPDYIEEHGCHDWKVVYDARGHFEEPHNNRRIGCGTIEVGNYLHAMKEPEIVPPEFSDAAVDITGPSGGFGAIMYCEKEGFDPLFKAVDLANRYDLMIISNKGLSVTACRQLIDEICGNNDLPLFVLHDFDVAGFLIFGTLQRDTRRYQFFHTVKVIDLGLRLADVAGLEREPAAATKTGQLKLREQLANNGATEDEINILVSDRVELNAMTSDALVAMIERKFNEYGLRKVVPDDKVLKDTYRAFDRSRQLAEKFKQIEEEFEKEKAKVVVPKDLRDQVCKILTKQTKLRWDDAIKITLGATLEEVRAKKQEDKEKSGDFTDSDDEDDEDDDELDDEDDDELDDDAGDSSS